MHVHADMMRKGFAATILLPLLLCACGSGGEKPDEPQFEATARGVEIQIPAAGDRTLTASGRRLSAMRGSTLVLEGDAGIELDGAGGLRARADRIRLDGTEELLLEGSVKASFEVPAMAVGEVSTQ